MTDDSPWDSDPAFAQNNEWSKLTSDFTNVRSPPNILTIRERKNPPLPGTQLYSNYRSQSGYREGITAGKESALQSGFDAGFAQIGVPLGREIGLLRGTASALSTFLSSTSDTAIPDRVSLLSEVQDIQSQLSIIRFSDIVPRDLEAEQHAKEHLLAEDGDEDLIENEELIQKRKMEHLEDMMSSINTGGSHAQPQQRLDPDDVRSLRERLFALGRHINLDISFD
jgi:Essential protein Yae1, N terminal